MKKNYVACLLTVAVLLGGCGTAASSSGASLTPSSVSSVVESQTSSLPAVSNVQPETDTVSGSDASFSTASETSTVNGQTVPVDEKSWDIVQQYGFVNSQDDKSQAGQLSDLSYKLKSDTLKDEGEYYTIEADFSKKVEIPADLKAGDKVTVTLNELTQETDELTMGENGTLTGTEGNEYYYFDDTAKNGKVTLYEDSDDRVDDLFYTGTLCISKDAVTGAAIEQKPYETIAKDNLTDDPWFNGVYFDDRGVVVQLIFYGD